MAKTTPPSFWLVKSEPDVYPFEKLVQDKRARWDGVRNFQARNNLRAMQAGDLVFFYHSNVGKCVVGVAKVIKAAYPDPTAPGEDWSAVDIAPVKAFAQPVELATIKSDAALEDLELIRRSRLSVVPVSKAHFDHILKLGKTKL
jgi:predicted RNA-binding protein with PUA-like domain